MATTSILRPGLLEAMALSLAATGGTSSLDEPLRALGATVTAVSLDSAALEEPPLPEKTGVLVVDLRAAAGAHEALDAAWLVVRQAGAAQTPKVVLVAPADEPSRAGIENLARTTSIEWARFGMRIGAILPSAGTGDQVVADLVAYLSSPAGDYFSGAALTLGAS